MVTYMLKCDHEKDGGDHCNECNVEVEVKGMRLGLKKNSTHMPTTWLKQNIIMLNNISTNIQPDQNLIKFNRL